MYHFKQEIQTSTFVFSLHCGDFFVSMCLYKGEGNGNPLHYSCLENSVDGGAWLATVHGVAKSQTRLSDFTFFLSIFLFGGRNGNPLQCSCLEDPMDGGAWWANLWGCKELDKIKQLTHSLVYKSLLNELA